MRFLCLIEKLLKHGFKISMSHKGNPYDNAKAESFIKTLKSEEVYLWEYSTFEDVQKKIHYFIDAVYNQNGCMPRLVICRQMNLKQKGAPQSISRP